MRAVRRAALAGLAVLAALAVIGGTAVAQTVVLSGSMGARRALLLIDGTPAVDNLYDQLYLGHDAVLDVDHTRLIRAQSASFRPEVEGDERCVRVSFDHNDVQPKRVDIKPEPWIEGPHRKEEEFTRAIGLALLDYMRKSRSQGFVVSLSGGADSAACCVLIYTALRMAEAELGWEGLQKRLAHVRGIASLHSVQELMPKVLTTAYQATHNSGDVTRNAARAVAEAVHADHFELDVDALVKSYVAMIEGAVGRPLWRISAMVSGATEKSGNRAANRASRRMRTGSSAKAGLTWRKMRAPRSPCPP